MALLCNEETPQTPDCELGPIWDNCGGPADIIDDLVGQADEDAECLKDNEVLITFRVSASDFEITNKEFCSATFGIEIDIIACAPGGHRRQDILDEVESRIYHRLLSDCTYADAETGQTLSSPLKMADRNSLSGLSSDETDFDGKQTVRTINLNFTTKPCIARPCCEAKPICFDFSKLGYACD